MRRPQPLQQNEVTDLSCSMITRLGWAREKYVPLRESSKMFAPKSESWPRRNDAGLHIHECRRRTCRPCLYHSFVSLCRRFHCILLYQVNDFLRSCFTASAVVPQSNQLNFTKSAGGDGREILSWCAATQLTRGIGYGQKTACELWETKKVRSSGILPLPRFNIAHYSIHTRSWSPDPTAPQ